LSAATIDSWGAAEKRLESLPPGTLYWDAVNALQMVLLTFDSDTTYKTWLADGYLGAGWERLTPAGYFGAWRFGCIQDNKETPKLALISQLTPALHPICVGSLTPMPAVDT
jgi:hypothetical protein